jgi:hypothetical protein
VLVNNTTGSNNTANGYQALYHNTSGSSNIALGFNAGLNLTTGDNNIDIGNAGVADEANTIRIGDSTVQSATFIAGIYSTPVTGGVPVVVNSLGQLGISSLGTSSPSAPASRRSKQEMLRYEAMNTKLRSEFLKEHKAFVAEQHKVQELQANAARQQKQIEVLTAGLQKVSAQLELSKPPARTGAKNQR